jgi:hypothetical protein
MITDDHHNLKVAQQASSEHNTTLSLALPALYLEAVATTYKSDPSPETTASCLEPSPSDPFPVLSMPLIGTMLNTVGVFFLTHA